MQYIHTNISIILFLIALRTIASLHNIMEHFWSGWNNRLSYRFVINVSDWAC